MKTIHTAKGLRGWALGLVLGLLGACHADDRALVLDGLLAGLRASERCASAVAAGDDAGASSPSSPSSTSASVPTDAGPGTVDAARGADVSDAAHAVDAGEAPDGGHE